MARNEHPKQWKCRHDHLRGIYGDEINWCGGKRSQCLDCGRWFPEPPRNVDLASKQEAQR